MITLYQFGNSVCCQKVRVTLSAKGLDWKSSEINLFKNEQYSPEYLKLNPSGLVPTLVRDGDVVNESTLICEYLDEVYPDPPLMPVSPIKRAQARRWAKFVDEGLHEGVSVISFSAMFRERMKKMSPEERQGRYDNVGDPRRRDLMMSTFELGTRAPLVLYGVAGFERAFKRLEDVLADSDWIVDATPTLADIALMPYVARLDLLKLLDLWIAHRPNVRAWWDRVQKWPSYQEGISRPMLPQEIEEMGMHGPSIRADLAGMLKELRAG
jgi:glutathione S-transferase